MSPAPRRPPLAPTPDLSQCACFNVRKAARAATQLYDDLLRPSGLRVTQFSLLTVVRLLGSATIGGLAEAAVMDRTTLTRNLKILAAAGLIVIREGDDARVREVTLTAAGRARLAAAQPYWERAQRRMAEALGPARLARLLGDLSAAVAAAQAA
jgi:DNA-binding MarR family transcriptional regulator